MFDCKIYVLPFFLLSSSLTIIAIIYAYGSLFHYLLTASHSCQYYRNRRKYFRQVRFVFDCQICSFSRFTIPLTTIPIVFCKWLTNSLIVDIFSWAMIEDDFEYDNDDDDTFDLTITTGLLQVALQSRTTSTKENTG